MSAKVLVVADLFDGALQSSTHGAVECAAGMSPESIEVLVLAEDASSAADEAAKIDGVTRVLTVSRSENGHPMAAVMAPQVVAAIEAGDYSHLLVPNTTFGKDVTPRIAALLGVGMVTDIAKVNSPYEFERPIYAGNAVNTVQAPEDQILVASVRGASYNGAAAEGGSASVEALDITPELPEHTKFVDMETQGSDRPDLGSAPTVVSGGRGVGSEDNFKVIYSFADKIGAAVGASRAAVDAGFVPNDMQVGQTGKIISPQLYMCFGISGAIQHLAGIKDAQTIVAVNKDEEAPIFEVADFGLVGDLFEVLPQLEEKVS